MTMVALARMRTSGTIRFGGCRRKAERRRRYEPKGSGTGSLKYAAVADWIYQRIPAVLKLLFTSSDIEKMIEAALEEAKKAWGANENLKGYIDTPSVESLLVGIEAQTVQTEPAEN